MNSIGKNGTIIVVARGNSTKGPVGWNENETL